MLCSSPLACTSAHACCRSLCVCVCMVQSCLGQYLVDWIRQSGTAAVRLTLDDELTMGFGRFRMPGPDGLGLGALALTGSGRCVEQA